MELQFKGNSFDSKAITQEINRPSHYGSKSGRDVIDWCEDFGLMGNAYIFNIFKYLARAGKKKDNSELQDAMKARVYLNRYIEKLERDLESNECKGRACDAGKSSLA